MRDYGSSLELFQSTREHVLYAFSVLDAFLNNKDYDVQPNFEDVNTALFVTWNLDHRLRGCIGTLEPRMLHKALKDYALTSAGDLIANLVLTFLTEHGMLACNMSRLLRRTLHNVCCTHIIAVRALF